MTTVKHLCVTQALARTTCCNTLHRTLFSRASGFTTVPVQMMAFTSPVLPGDSGALARCRAKTDNANHARGRS